MIVEKNLSFLDIKAVFLFRPPKASRKYACISLRNVLYSLEQTSSHQQPRDGGGGHGGGGGDAAGDFLSSSPAVSVSSQSAVKLLPGDELLFPAVRGQKSSMSREAAIRAPEIQQLSDEGSQLVE